MAYLKHKGATIEWECPHCFTSWISNVISKKAARCPKCGKEAFVFGHGHIDRPCPWDYEHDCDGDDLTEEPDESDDSEAK